MIEFFKDIFQYHRHFNLALAEMIEAHLPELPETVLPLFCHILNAHQIWNARIQKQPTVGVRDVHELSMCRKLIEEAYDGTMSITKAKGMDETLTYKNSKGIEFTGSIRDILFHISNHTTHHRGQIIATFRSQGIDPPVSDYIFYRRDS